MLIYRHNGIVIPTTYPSTTCSPKEPFEPTVLHSSPPGNEVIIGEPSLREARREVLLPSQSCRTCRNLKLQKLVRKLYKNIVSSFCFRLFLVLDLQQRCTTTYTYKQHSTAKDVPVSVIIFIDSAPELRKLADGRRFTCRSALKFWMFVGSCLDPKSTQWSRCDWKVLWDLKQSCLIC